MAVASAGPYADSLHLAPDTSSIFLQTRSSSYYELTQWQSTEGTAYLKEGVADFYCITW